MQFKAIPALVFSLLVVTGCSHPSKKITHFRSGYETAVENLGTINSFAFQVQNDRYYFAPASFDTGQGTCHLYMGFKNNQLAYRFSYSQLQELRRIYEAKLNIHQKMRQALARIEKFPKSKDVCPHPTSKRDSSPVADATEATLTFLVYSPAIVLSVFLVPHHYVFAIKDHFLEKRLRKVRLGMTSSQVNKLVREDVTSIHSLPYVIDHVKTKDRQLVFVYENDRLVAYVWGK